MAISGITVTNNNGVDRITNNQQVTGTATVTGETLVLDGSSSVLETGTSAGSISIKDSAIVIDSDTPTGNDDGAVLNYGGRTVTGTTLEIEDSQIIIVPLTARHNIQVTDLRRVKVIESDSSGYMFVYTKGGGDVIDVLFKGINVWEVYAAGNFVNITVDSTNFGYLNWEAGRLDFFGFAVNNIGVGHLWMGTGASDNACWHWNNDSSFNNQLMYITASNNRYYEGFTASWKFIDQLTLAAVEDVVVIFRDNMSGSQAVRGTYVTNSSGHLTGTYDSQNRTTGGDTERPILFMLTNQVVSIDTGSPGSYSYPTTVLTGDQGDRSYNYDIDPIQPAIEVRSYLHVAPSGFGPSDTFTPTIEIGKRASDGTVDQYQDFVLSPDLGIVASYATASAYTTIADMQQLYDRLKAEWYDNNGYPVPTKDGIIIDLGAVNLVLDGDAGSAYAYSSNTITVKTSNLDPVAAFTTIETTGVVTLQDGATFDGTSSIFTIINGDVQLTEVADMENVHIKGDLDTSAAGTYNFSNVIVDGDVTNSDGTGNALFNLTNGSSMTTTEPGTGNGQVQIVNLVPIKVTVKDASTLALIQGARVYIKTAAGGPASPDVELVNELTDVSGEVNTTVQYDGDQPVVGTVRKGS
jgi:hypothetical protein